MPEEMTLAELDRWLQRIVWSAGGDFRSGFRAAGGVIRKAHKELFEKHISPDGRPIRMVDPLPVFRPGDIWFSAKSPTGGEKFGAFGGGFPMHIRTERAAKRANKAWNERWKKRAKVKGRQRKSLPKRARGGSAYPALYRRKGDRIKGLFKAVVSRTAPGHLEIPRERSLIMGPKGPIPKRLASGGPGHHPRDFHGLNGQMINDVADKMLEFYLKKIMK